MIGIGVVILIGSAELSEEECSVFARPYDGGEAEVYTSETGSWLRPRSSHKSISETWTFEAAAYKGFIFERWQGDINSTENPVTVTRINNMRVFAIFRRISADSENEEKNHAEAQAIEKENAPGEGSTILLPGKVPLDLVWIPAGSYQRGASIKELDYLENELPQHEVTLTEGFWMGKYVVTKAQWEAVMETTPWAEQRFVLNEPDSPAVYISWDDAQVFIDNLNTLTGRNFRLPTEAEWEYAARAGTTTCFYWGDDEDYSVMPGYAWFKDNAFETGEHYAHIVGQKKPNAWELYDMAGNVWEWCQDWYAYYPNKKNLTDPKGPKEGDYKILRGGSWFYYGGFSRMARRDHLPPAVLSYEYGFRIAE